jgi:hypothetical protein
MLEIKCPLSRPIYGIPPIYYWYQMQIQLEVANLPRCDFLECKIVEKEEEEFLELLNEYNIKKTVEVGFIIQVLDKNKNKDNFIYYPYNSNITEFKNWEENEINEILKDNNKEYIKTIYWVLEEYGLCKIYRDIDWYNNNIEHLTNFWNEVLDGRSNKKVDSNKIINDKLKLDKSNTLKISKYLMFDSDSD